MFVGFGFAGFQFAVYFVGFDFAYKDGGGVTVGFIGFGFLIGCVFFRFAGFQLLVLRDCWFCW